ncbi:MAG: prefoldin subunit alpha [Desulfurococcaceae archaeon]|jgi:prefoldin alpha subunit|nr:prefoldin subunit alpha [Desulfurococcaceae archaeon]MCC6054089.1 prefoldin subunit alpha [Thermosphaera sp.]
MTLEKTPREERRVITLEELVARVEELRESIEVLDSAINTYLSQYRELQLSLETLKNLGETPGEGYIIIDRLSSIMIPAKILEKWESNLLVNLGLGYYLKTNREKAIEILTKRIQVLEGEINQLQSRRRAMAEEYLGLQRILNQVIQSQQQKTR